MAGPLPGLAESPLEGIEDAADELAALAARDRMLMERVRRRLLAERKGAPGDRTLKQMLALWRRALERGVWDWEE